MTSASATVKPSGDQVERTLSSSGMLNALKQRQHAVPATASARPSTAPHDDKHEALGEHLANQPAAPGAERGANGHLLLPRGRAREQEIGQIGADDQHDDADRAGEHQERVRAGVPLTCPASRLRRGSKVAVGIRRRIGFASTSSSAWALWAVTPGFIRPTIARVFPKRFVLP